MIDGKFVVLSAVALFGEYPEVISLDFSDEFLDSLTSFPPRNHDFDRQDIRAMAGSRTSCISPFRSWERAFIRPRMLHFR
jgi:hypothetical protein